MEEIVSKFIMWILLDLNQLFYFAQFTDKITKKEQKAEITRL